MGKHRLALCKRVELERTYKEHLRECQGGIRRSILQISSSVVLLLWSDTSITQRHRNRCHRNRRNGAFPPEQLERMGIKQLE